MLVENYILTKEEIATLDTNLAIGKCQMFETLLAEAQQLLGVVPGASNKIAALEAKRDAAIYRVYVSILAARNPSIIVPEGSTITRGMVDGVDTLTVASP